MTSAVKQLRRADHEAKTTGVKLYGEPIGLRPDTETALSTDLARFPDYPSSFNAARVSKREETEPQNAADLAARLFL